MCLWFRSFKSVCLYVQSHNITYLSDKDWWLLWPEYASETTQRIIKKLVICHHETSPLHLRMLMILAMIWNPRDCTQSCSLGTILDYNIHCKLGAAEHRVPVLLGERCLGFWMVGICCNQELSWWWSWCCLCIDILNSCGDDPVFIFRGCDEFIDGMVAETKSFVLVFRDIKIN